MHYDLYKTNKLELINEETGIENVGGIIRDEKELNFLREEMRLKREKLISEEILESVRNLSVEGNTGSNNESNIPNSSQTLSVVIFVFVVYAFLVFLIR